MSSSLLKTSSLLGRRCYPKQHQQMIQKHFYSILLKQSQYILNNNKIRYHALLKRKFSRQSLPPMPRILPNTNSSNQSIDSNITTTTTTSNPSWLRRSWDNGNILLSISFGILCTILIDRYLQVEQTNDNFDMKQMKLSIMEDTAKKRYELFNDNINKQTLYQCKIITLYKNMGGTHGLQNMKLNDIIDIIDENVGPEEYYHLCRTYTINDKNEQVVDSIGWYPKQYLEKVIPIKPSIWKRIIGKA